MKIKLISFCMMFSLLLGACNKWIDVKPSDRLNEDQLFSTREGYLNALNGVYVELTNSALYGENMSFSTLDVLANYYFMNISTHRYYNTTTFVYTAENTRTAMDNIWKKAYELIVNCNVIIDKCGENSNPLLPAPYFGIVKGEALALRAMLHFDMLRLFGPIWSEADKGRACIPYNTAPRPTVTGLLSSEKIMEQVFNDLNAAAGLLKENDPVITEGIRHGANPVGSNDFYFRQYRLNYYAVKALMARAYLWKNDKENAMTEAMEVLTETLTGDNPVFGLGPYDPAATPADFDHIFIPEVMFSLYKINRQNIYTNFFAPDLQKELRLSFNNYDDNQGRKNALYDDLNDFRLKSWLTLSNTNGNFLTHVKYAVSTNKPAPNAIPLIRLSELILLAAECSPTLEDGTAFLNMLRTARNCVSLAPTTTTQLKDFITREFRKEMIGEGQMFFYYKRNAMTAIPNHAHLTNTKQMQLGNYIVPLPLSEISVRGN